MSAHLTALLAASLWLHAAAVPTGNHTCTGVIKHPVTVLVNVTEPVTFRSYTWCLRVPPRCSKYTVQLKDRVKLHTEMHNKTITVCCRGFVEMENRCVPACPEGADCPFMKCNRTNHCHCTPGYSGLYCNEACPRGLWGKDCKRPCDCPTGYTCHHLTGDCFVDDRPPRRTTTTTTTTKRPTTTTTLSPTTEGTTLETVKTPVFRFPPPPWVESASTGKKTTTRQVKKEDEPRMSEIDFPQTTPSTVVTQRSTTEVLSETSVPTLPTVRMTSVEKPPILEFLPPLTDSEQAITEELEAKIVTKPYGIKTTPTSIEVVTRHLEADILPDTTFTKLLEQTTVIDPSNLKPVLKTSLEMNTITTETLMTTEPVHINVTSNSRPAEETTPMVATTNVHLTQPFVTWDTKPQLITETTSTTTTSTPKPTRATDAYTERIILSTQQVRQKNYVTHESESAENKLENEILTQIHGAPVNNNILEETIVATTTLSNESTFSLKTKSTLSPFLIIPFTFSKQTEPMKKKDGISTLKDSIIENQYPATIPKIYKPTESIHFEVIESMEKKLEETKSTKAEDNFKVAANTNHDTLKTTFAPSASSKKRLVKPVSPKTTTEPAVILNNEHTISVPLITTNPIEITAATELLTASPATTATIIQHTATISAYTTSKTTKLETLPSFTLPPTTITTVPSTAVPIPITAPSTTTMTSPTTIDLTTAAPTTLIPTTVTTTTTPTTSITTTTTEAITTASTTSATSPTITTTETPLTSYTTTAPVSVSDADNSYIISKPQTADVHQTTMSIPAIVEEIFKELNIQKKAKLDEGLVSHTALDKPKKKHEKIKSKNINVKEISSIYQTKVDKHSETSFQPTTEITFKSLLHAETYKNTTLSTKPPSLKQKPTILDLMNKKYATEEVPDVEITSNGPTPTNPDQIWGPIQKNNVSDIEMKNQEQFGAFDEPSKGTQPSMASTGMKRVVESNTIDYHQSSEVPLKKMMSQEEETNYSLIFNKIKFNMTDSVAAGVKASRDQESHLHIPMILVLGVALVTLLLLTLTLWVYLKRRRERSGPFPPCIMAYAMQEPPPLDSDSFDHPFFCPTFTNNYGERINRELRELSYDHPRSSQPEPLYAEVRY